MLKNKFMIRSNFVSEHLRENKTPLYITMAIMVVLTILYFLVPGVKGFFDEAWEVLTSNNKQRISFWVEDFSWFGPLLLFLAMVAQMFFVVIPSIPLLVVSVLIYGPIYGTIIAFAGIFAASSLGYILGKYLSPVLIGRIIGKRSIEKGSDFLKKYGFWAIFITRLSPFLYNDAVSLVSGILKMNYWKFIGANLAGIAPLILLIATLGGSTHGLKTGFIWSSIISLIILLLYVFWDKKKIIN